MKQVAIDSLKNAVVPVTVGVGGHELIQPHTDTVSTACNLLITIATVVGAVWTPAKAIISVFKKKK